MDTFTRCRICLEKSQELKPMLTTWNNSINLWNMYDYILNVRKSVDSAFIPHICMKCEKDLTSAYFFQLMCSETENKLSELASIDRISLVRSDPEFVIELVKSEDNSIADTFETYTVEAYDIKYHEESKTEELFQSEDNCTADTLRTDIAEVEDMTNDDNVWNKTVDKNINHIAVIAETATEPIKPKVVKSLGRKCNICNIQYDSMKAYMVHYRKLHYRPVKIASVSEVLCPYCGKLVPQHSIGKHIQNSHSIDKKTDHSCSQCGKSYKRVESLIQHKRMHSNDKRYACDVCGEKFLHWSSRRNHIRAKHTGEQKYECNICGKVFAHSSNLFRHIRRHTNDLRVSCGVCSKRFLTKDELMNHNVVHTKEKNEMCMKCLKCFGTRKNLQAHMKVHSDERKHICSVCNRGFKQPHVLRTHLKTHSKVETPKRDTVLQNHKKRCVELEVCSNVLMSKPIN